MQEDEPQPEHENPVLEDGRPVEVRSGEDHQSPEDCEEDVQDASTVESVGY